jgi:DNA-binding MarR family transcriptional regulator
MLPTTLDDCLEICVANLYNIKLKESWKTELQGTRHYRLSSFRILFYIGCEPNRKTSLSTRINATGTNLMHILKQLEFTGTRVPNK